MEEAVTTFIDTFSLDPPPSVIDPPEPVELTVDQQVKVDAIMNKYMPKRWSEILEERYSPGQPRDDHGRFAGGAGASAPKEFAGATYAPTNSLYGHLVSNGNGGYKLDADRQALHQQILNKYTSAIPASDHPTAFIMGGGPAAGKSSAMTYAGVPTKDEAVHVDPDAMKGELPEYQKAIAAGDPAAAQDAHEESSYLSKQLVALSIANGQTYVLDGTGDKSVASAQTKIDLPRANGYTVKGVYVTCPTQDALDRNQARGQVTGRFVPPDELAGIHSNISNIVPAIANKFDQFTLIDTTNTHEGDPAHVIATAGRDQPISIKDGAAYQAFLDKAKK